MGRKRAASLSVCSGEVGTELASLRVLDWHTGQQPDDHLVAGVLGSGLQQEHREGSAEDVQLV